MRLPVSLKRLCEICGSFLRVAHVLSSLVLSINETERAGLGVVYVGFFLANCVAFSTTSVIRGTIQECLDFKLFMRSKLSNVV